MSADAEDEDRLDGQLRKAYKEGLFPSIAVSAGGLQLFKPTESEQTGGNAEGIRQALQGAKPHVLDDTPFSGTTLAELDSGDTMLDDEQDDSIDVADRE